MFTRSHTQQKELFSANVQDILTKQYIVTGKIITARKQSDMFFVKIRDGSCVPTLQLIFNAGDFDKAKLQTGAWLKIRGTVVKPPETSKEPFEMCVDDVIDISLMTDPKSYPFAKKGHTLEHTRMYPHMRSVLTSQQVISRVRDEASRAIHDFYKELNMRWIHTPILTSSDCEGAGEVVSATTLMGTGKIKDISPLVVKETETYISEKTGKTKKKKVLRTTDLIDFGKDMYHRRVYLTVSGQLHVEVTACQLGDSYTFGPIFRAEGTDSYKHLGEAWLIEPELVDVDLSSLIDHAEDTIKRTITYIKKVCNEELKFLEKEYSGHIEKLNKFESEPFIRITHSEAVAILRKATDDGIKFEHPVMKKMDFGSEHEKYLTDVHFKGKIVVITKWPKDIKAFYMLESSDDENLCDCFDILCPFVGEIVGGSMREHRHSKLMETMSYRKMDPEPLEYYTEIRKYGCPPHGGYGIGLDRLIMLITGVPHIKEVVTFPRTSGSIIC